MNTLLSIIKGSFFNQYDFHNVLRHMVLIVHSTKIYAICFSYFLFSNISCLLIIFDPYNFRGIKNEHSRCMKRAFAMDKYGYGFSSMQQSRKINVGYKIYAARLSRTANEESIVRSTRQAIGKQHKRERDEPSSVMILVFAFLHFRRFVRINS